MKLNPKKCTFGIEEGMFLGYKVSTRGLKVCPDKVDAILSLSSPKCLKDVQKLNGKLVSLNKFLAKSAEKSLPFFKTLKKCTKKSNFHWTTEAEEAFKQMKQLIRAPHVGRTNGKGRTHCLPGSGKRNGKHSLDDGKGNQENAHILCQQGIKKSKNKLHIDGKISVGLGACQPRVSVKGKILADFIVERPEEDSLDTLIEIEEELPDPWILFTDGSSYRWLRSRTNTHKSRRDRIYLCP
ncbi:hypothetical protein Tco_1222807 [Tanacetum coccineum]